MKTTRPLLLAAVLLVPAAALAQAPEQVKVGNQMKRAYGTVQRMENGDIACYLHMKDDRGAAFTEMADFEICMQKPSVVGKRVRLEYQVSRVQSASCQGDPDCKKSDVVALVSKATPAAAGAAGAAPAAKPAASASAGSHCSTGEVEVFACRTGDKAVSVCASRDFSAKGGYAQYRFGKLGETPEMLLPARQEHPGRTASGEAAAYAGGGGAWLRFTNGAVAYVVYSGVGRWGPKGETEQRAGVVVERNGKRTANVRCVGKERSLLGPDWFQKSGVQPKRDDDFVIGE